MKQKADIRLFKINESTVRVSTSPEINNELISYFSARVQNYQFMPQYKLGIWDGYLKFYKRGNLLPLGLSYNYIDDFAKSGGYSVYANWDRDTPIDISRDDWKKFIDLLQVPFEVRDYQFEASLGAISHQKECIQLPTASGKSLIIYIMARWMEQAGKKCLIVVPQQQLVEQLFSNFIEYGWNDTFEKVHKIYSGKDKEYKKPIIITTWQSLYKEQKIFKEFDCLIVDEAHGTKANSLKTISERSVNAEWKIGLSGTYHDSKNKAELYGIVGSLGPIRVYADYKKLTEDGYLATLNIKNLFLRYDQETSQRNFLTCRKDFQKETVFINNLEVRNNFIIKLANRMKKNTFILFTREKHGREIECQLKKITSKNVFYIDGKVKVEKREMIRHSLEKEENAILVASFGTFKQGIDIKNVHNIIFASNYMSKIIVLQSIGRGLRKNNVKEKVNVYDIIDDLSFLYKEGKRTRKYLNFSIRHYNERKKIYKSQGFDNIENFNIKIG